MKSGIVRNIILLLVILVNIYLVLTLFPKKSKPISERIITVQDQMIQDVIIQLLESQNKKIADSTYFTATNNLRYSTGDLVGARDTWFLYLPSKSCHNCLSNILADIEVYWGNEQLNKIIFYTSFNDNQSVAEIEKDFEIPVLNIGNNYLGIPHERRQEYFIFCLDREERVKYFFPLNQDRPKLNILFFRFIRTQTT